MAKKNKDKEKVEKKVVVKIGGIRIGRLIKTVLILLLTIFMFSSCVAFSSNGCLDCTFGDDSKSDRPATGGSGLIKIPTWLADLLPSRPDWLPDEWKTLFWTETDNNPTPDDNSSSDTEGGSSNSSENNGNIEDDDNTNTQGIYVIRFIDEHTNMDVSYNTNLNGQISFVPTPSSRAGYTFRGWYDENWLTYYRPLNSMYCNTEYEFAGNTTLRAYWRKNDAVNITFYVDETATEPYATYSTNTDGILENFPYNPTKDGKYFQYWVLKDTNYPLTTASIHDFDSVYYAVFGDEPLSSGNGDIVSKCDHEYVDGICTKCGQECAHSFFAGVCTECGENEPKNDDSEGDTPFTEYISLVPSGGNNTMSGTKDGDYNVYSPDGESSDVDTSDFNTSENDRDERYVYVKFFYKHVETQEYEDEETGEVTVEEIETTIYFGTNEFFEFMIDMSFLSDVTGLIYYDVNIEALAENGETYKVSASEYESDSLNWQFYINEDDYLCVKINGINAFIVGGRNPEGFWHPISCDGALYNGLAYELIAYNLIYPN